LRNTFRFVTVQMGLRFIGRVPGAKHALVFQRTDDYLQMGRARRAEVISKIFGSILNSMSESASLLKRSIFVMKN